MHKEMMGEKKKINEILNILQECRICLLLLPSRKITMEFLEPSYDCFWSGGSGTR